MAEATDQFFHQQLLRQFHVQAAEQLQIFGTAAHDLLHQVDTGGQPASTCADALFALIHTIKGNAAMLGLRSIADICHDGEQVLSRVCHEELDLDAPILSLLLTLHDHLQAVLAHLKAHGEHHPFADALQARGEQLREALAQWRQPLQDEDAILADLQVLGRLVAGDTHAEEALLRLGQRLVADGHLGDPLAEALTTGTPPADPLKCLRSFLAAQEWLQGPLTSERTREVAQWLTAACDLYGEGPHAEALAAMQEAWDLFIDSVGLGPELAEILLRHMPADSTPALKATPPASPLRQQDNQPTMRVEERSIDAFLHLVGELSVVGDMFEHLHGHIRLLPGAESIAGEFSQIQRSFVKLSQELQDAIIAVRRVSLRPLVYKQQQLVRHVSATLGKEVRLEVSGADVLVDKSLMDPLDTALGHLIRNAIDHGIEPPEARTEAGKSATGTVHLHIADGASCYQLQLADDGGGIDEEALGLRSDGGGTLLEHLCAPGVSSAASVSEISGRGVGMHAVHEAVVQSQGTLAVENLHPNGCRFTISLPKAVTTQFLNGYLVAIGPATYALPVAQVDGARRNPTADIHVDPQGRRCVRLDTATLPFLDLRPILDPGSRPDSGEAPLIVICHHGDRRYALGVDRLVGIRKLVHRDLPGETGANPAISGAALLGNGTIALLLDLGALITSAAASPPSLAPIGP